MKEIKVYVKGAGVTSSEMLLVRRESESEIVAVTSEDSETEYIFDRKTGKRKNPESMFGFTWSIDPYFKQ